MARRRRPTRPARLAAANINPATGLATDYLNHFNEAIMLLEMLSACPECRDDFLDWQPLSYREHFEASRFKGRALAVAAYDAADPNLRFCLDTLAGSMTAVLEATRAAMNADIAPAAAVALAERAAALLKPAGRARRRRDQWRGHAPANRRRRRRWSTADEERSRMSRKVGTGFPPREARFGGLEVGQIMRHGNAERANLSDAPHPGGQRGHYPRRQGAGGAARAQAGARCLHAAGRRRGNGRDAHAGGDARSARGNRSSTIEPVALAGHREAIVRDAQGGVERHFVILCFAARWLSGEPVLNEELDDARWLEPAALAGLRTTEGLAEIVNAALERLARPS